MQTRNIIYHTCFSDNTGSKAALSNFIDMVQCLNRSFVDGHYLVTANTIASTYIPMLIEEVDAFIKMSKKNGGTGAFVKYSQDGATNIRTLVGILQPTHR